MTDVHAYIQKSRTQLIQHLIRTFEDMHTTYANIINGTDDINKLHQLIVDYVVIIRQRLDQFLLVEQKRRDAQFALVEQKRRDATDTIHITDNKHDSNRLLLEFRKKECMKHKDNIDKKGAECKSMIKHKDAACKSGLEILNKKYESV